MKSRSALAMVSGLAALALAATGGSALAMGHHGHGHHGDDMHFAMLARAAGVSGETIHSTFKNDTQLRTDFQNVMKARKAMDACIIGGCNNGEIAAYTSAESALTQQKLNDWQTIFAGAPNKGAATSLKTQLDALHQQKRQLMQQAFNSSKGGTTTAPPAASQQ